MEPVLKKQGVSVRKYHIYGLVQGVGFRPFVAKLAAAYGLYGYVRNDGGIVTALFCGETSKIDDVCRRLTALNGVSEELPGALVERICACTLSEEEEAFPMQRAEGFQIVESVDGADALRMLPPDIATCDSCVKELFSHENRRFRHPFISCTACGPRYTIMDAVPYDRIRTTMKSFPMCPRCDAEYAGEEARRKDGGAENTAAGPDEKKCAGTTICGQLEGKKTGAARRITPHPTRRFAQTIACPDCGPRLLLYGEKSAAPCLIAKGEDALTKTVDALWDGRIVAVKDVGGYHLCFDARNVSAVRRLREWKNRENKPFAVMLRTLSAIRSVAEVSETEEGLLTSTEAPIVLLKKKTVGDAWGEIPPETLGDSNRIGAFLPSNPVQHLLFAELEKRFEEEGKFYPAALVMTSGNRGGEPIITKDADMLSLLATGVPDLVLANDREIRYGLDDSIYQVTTIGTAKASRTAQPREVIQILRRARGIVPKPVWLSSELPCDTFAAGGDLKAVFALGRKNAVYLSGHFGDLTDVRCVNARRESIAHLKTLLGISPEQVLCDKHPLYVSARETAKTTVQHHHAHILSVIAEHALTGPVLGAAFDGTGYGDDGTIWGGEFLLCDAGTGTYQRVGHLQAVPLLGGDAAAREAEKTAFCYLYEATRRGCLTEDEFSCIPLGALGAGNSGSDRSLLSAALKHRINVTENSSMGRLFDAAAAILGICFENTYEGECPVKLQYAAERYPETENRRKTPGGAPHLTIPLYSSATGWVADTPAFLAELAKQRLRGIGPDALAYAFHVAVAEMTVAMCERSFSQEVPAFCETNPTIALSGGTFLNSLLLQLLLPEAEHRGWRVCLNEQVPPGDGGLALGQTYFAVYDKRKTEDAE